MTSATRIETSSRSTEIVSFETRPKGLRVEPGPAARDGGELTPKPVVELIRLVEVASLPSRVQKRARAVLRALGEAESRVRGHSDPLLYELGDDDTILDAVGCCSSPSCF